VKVSADRRHVGNAIERFLGRGRDEIRRVAKETLEGHLRGVVATLTPEEVNEDRLKFAAVLEAEASADLRKLGLRLDTLKIQAVSDGRGYLDSIGRKRIAEQSNGLRRYVAELDARVRTEEERTEAAAAEARATAEKELQEVRTELERLRLAAEVTIPAEISRRAAEVLAVGQAAPIEARGRASAEALGLVAEAWREADGRALDIHVLQHLEELMAPVAEAVKRVHVKHAALVDAGDGKALPTYLASYPAMVGALLRETGNAVGLDMARVINKPTPRLS
jgi:flotillin